MHCLYAAQRQVTKLEEIIVEEGLDDVTIKAPFMGRVVVWCGSDHSQTLLEGVLNVREREAA